MAAHLFLVRRGLTALLPLLVVGCAASPGPLEGVPCVVDSDCSEGLVCYRERCVLDDERTPEDQDAEQDGPTADPNASEQTSEQAEDVVADGEQVAAPLTPLGKGDSGAASSAAATPASTLATDAGVSSGASAPGVGLAPGDAGVAPSAAPAPSASPAPSPSPAPRDAGLAPADAGSRRSPPPASAGNAATGGGIFGGVLDAAGDTLEDLLGAVGISIDLD